MHPSISRLRRPMFENWVYVETKRKETRNEWNHSLLAIFLLFDLGQVFLPAQRSLRVAPAKNHFFHKEFKASFCWGSFWVFFSFFSFVSHGEKGELFETFSSFRLGLNTPALAELGDRWAGWGTHKGWMGSWGCCWVGSFLIFKKHVLIKWGSFLLVFGWLVLFFGWRESGSPRYVFGRISMAMEAVSFFFSWNFRASSTCLKNLVQTITWSLFGVPFPLGD